MLKIPTIYTSEGQTLKSNQDRRIQTKQSSDLDQNTCMSNTNNVIETTS